MKNPSDLSVFERFNNWLRRSISLKILAIFFLMLILLIPSTMVQELIRERQQTRNEAIAEVSSKWGETQTISGPVLSIPYRTTVENEKGQTVTVVKQAHFLPENLDVNGKLAPEKRYRGIYVVMLYNSILRIQGQFMAPDFQKLKIKNESVLWDEAKISLGITDLKGVKQAIKLTFNNAQREFEPGQATTDLFASGVGVPVQLMSTDSGRYAFSIDLNLNGSSEIQFLPYGKETHVTLQSSWPTPSFVGNFLPEKRDVTDNGFTASWKVLQYNRNYAQQGIGSFIPADKGNGSFGVKLLLPVDEYQKTTRSAKYSTIFVAITFLTFFFVEILGGKRIHPIQYLLVGFAICLFYILLLSISEHLPFHWAYIIGTVSVIILLFMYTKSIFKNYTYTSIFTFILALLYGFFYSLLQLEDYALLLGSIGLLVILALTMYLTRKIDWYTVYDER